MPARGFKLWPMNDAALKSAVDRFVANVSFSARRELEKVVRCALASGKLHDGETLTTAVTLSNQKVDLDITIFSKIEL
jgi:hypothetical protein